MLTFLCRDATIRRAASKHGRTVGTARASNRPKIVRLGVRNAPTAIRVAIVWVSPSSHSNQLDGWFFFRHPYNPSFFFHCHALLSATVLALDLPFWQPMHFQWQIPTSYRNAAYPFCQASRYHLPTLPYRDCRCNVDKER